MIKNSQHQTFTCQPLLQFSREVLLLKQSYSSEEEVTTFHLWTQHFLGCRQLTVVSLWMLFLYYNITDDNKSLNKHDLQKVI